MMKNLMNSNKDLKSLFVRWESLLILILGIVLVINSFLSPSFLSLNTFINSPMSFMDKSFVALGMALVLMLGLIDISVGSIVALTGVVMGLAYHSGLPFWLSIIIALLVGATCGFINGFLVTKFHESPPMIITLATMSLYRGLAYILVENRSLGDFPSWFQQLGWGKVAGIPIIMITFVLFAFLFWWLLHKTAFGREIRSIGFNKRASFYSGITVNKNIILVYVLLGIMATITGLFLISRMSSVRADIAVGYELEAIAMVVLGGVSTSGGVGSIVGVVISIFIVGFVRYGLGLANASSQLITLIIGLLLIIAVIIDEVRNKNYTFTEGKK